MGIAKWTVRATLFVAVCVTATPALSGNGGYMVTYNSKVKRGEVELMLMNDLTAPNKFRREEGLGDYLSHMVELEYGITSQLATEFMIEWFEDLKNGKSAFTGFRWETRFRLFKKRVPLNPMLYIEYEDLDPSTRYKMEVSGWVRPPYAESGAEADRERIIETRLVLSDDIGPVNIAFNWINETDLHSGTTAFGYALGVMWMIHGGHGSPGGGSYACPMHPSERQTGEGKCGKCGKCGMEFRKVGESSSSGGGGVGVGIEFYGGLGDTKSFGLSASRQEHYFGPILVFHATKKLMLHAQLAIGLTEASDNLVRFNIGYEF
jgi:hypothetical protein